jgi:hypothetical protein
VFGKSQPQQPRLSDLEEARKRQEEADRWTAQRKEQEARDEEKKAREEWERYHRFHRIEEVDNMTWLQFEEFIVALYIKAGYLNVEGTPINDQGADTCCQSQDGKKIVIQTKHWKDKVGNSAVQEILGAMVYYGADLGFVVTTSSFTPSAIALAAKDSRITLIDRNQLVAMLEQYWPRSAPEFVWSDYNRLVKKQPRRAPRVSEWNPNGRRKLSRKEAIHEARNMITDNQLTEFFRIVGKEEKKPFAITLINEAFDKGMSLNSFFNSRRSNGFYLSARREEASVVNISFGCNAGPCAGDGGEWTVAFDDRGNITSATLVSSWIS